MRQVKIRVDKRLPLFVWYAKTNKFTKTEIDKIHRFRDFFIKKLKCVYLSFPDHENISPGKCHILKIQTDTIECIATIVKKNEYYFMDGGTK